MEKSLDRFLHYLHLERGLAWNTITAYRLDIERGLIPFLHQRSKFEVAEVTRDDIRAHLGYLAATRGNCGATRARKLAAVKSFFNYLAENEGLEANPAASIRSPRIPQKEPVYLTDGESVRLLQTIAGRAGRQTRERDLAMVLLLLHAGLRVSELVNLKLANVDLEAQQIKITRKGNREQYLHLNGETVKALANYLASRPPAGNGNLWVADRGGCPKRAYIYELVRNYLELAGIHKEKRGPHLLRHTFCTRLHQKGVAPFTIKELAGHRQFNTTMRYIKIEDKEQSEAVDRLEFGIL
ncbi:Tyrosine recombinase XerD [subsurface metagenome]